MMIKAIIFDMDGVLIDSEPFYAQGVIDCFKHFEIEIIPTEVQNLAGASPKQYDEILKNICTSKKLDYESFNSYFMNYNSNLVVPYEELVFPEVKDQIKKLYDLGYLLAIASSSNLSDIRSFVATNKLDKYIKVLQSGEQLQESKPNPEIYLNTISMLNVPIDQCIAVEDSEIGIQAAKSAGLTCIARVDNRFNFNQNQADYFIDSLDDINSVLNEIINRKETV